MAEEAAATVATATDASATTATADTAATTATNAPATDSTATTATTTTQTATADTTATQATTETATDATTTEAAKPAPAVAPEKYDFVTPKDAVLDPAVTAEFAGIAKELNLTQEAAQKVIDKMAPLLSKNETARDAARVQAVVEKATLQWANEAKADTEYGGTNFDANLAIAKQTFAEFGTPALEAVLKASGLDSHPEMIRWAYRVGKQITPDGKIVSGNANTSPGGNTFEERAAAKLYGA